MNCLQDNGKEKINRMCTDQLENLRTCYHKSYADEFAIKMYNSQLDFILKNA